MNLLLYFILPLLFVQQPAPTCRVIPDEINETYEGECRYGFAHGYGIASGKDRYEGDFRRGLPHGRGTYTRSTGETYIGEWKRGMRHGMGLIINENKDTIAQGIWRDGGFLRESKGSKELPDYVVRYQRNITRLRFLNLSEGNRIFFKVDQGSTERQISHLNVFGSSGNYLAYPNMFGFEDVTFPFQGRIVFYGYSRTGYTVYQVELTMEINKPGNWEVHIIY